MPKWEKLVFQLPEKLFLLTFQSTVRGMFNNISMEKREKLEEEGEKKSWKVVCQG